MKTALLINLTVIKSRNFDNYKLVKEILDSFTKDNKISKVINKI